uniref:Uncharacterized protein n=1 Tax=Anopheles melas TaxID=34690 RepID=A0A182U9M3_9DIPT
MLGWVAPFSSPPDSPLAPALPTPVPAPPPPPPPPPPRPGRLGGTPGGPKRGRARKWPPNTFGTPNCRKGAHWGGTLERLRGASWAAAAAAYSCRAGCEPSVCRFCSIPWCSRTIACCTGERASSTTQPNGRDPARPNTHADGRPK